MRVQGNYVRGDFDDYGVFNSNWHTRYPGAWYARGYAAGTWSHATWPAINSWFDASWPATSYSYGDNITYEGSDVCLNGQPIASAADYYQSALNLAQTGEEADVPDEQPPTDGEKASTTDNADAQWLPLGIFEGIPPNEKSSHMLFQLAVNREGIVRGNYFNKSDKNAQQVQGAVDEQTQRVSWVVANRKDIIFDTGLYNLTKSETTVLVHEGPEKTQQWTFVRLNQPTTGTSQN